MQIRAAIFSRTGLEPVLWWGRN